jgi:hypothetical protein
MLIVAEIALEDYYKLRTTDLSVFTSRLSSIPPFGSRIDNLGSNLTESTLLDSRESNSPTGSLLQMS